MSQQITLTKEEQRAIASLKRLARRWPANLTLFGWSGTLCAMKRAPDGRLALIDDGFGSITCDGGDPSDVEVDQSPDIHYEGRDE